MGRKTGSLDRHYLENGDILVRINVGDTKRVGMIRVSDKVASISLVY